MTVLQTRRSVWILAGARHFFLENVHKGSGDPQASYSLGIGKWGGGGDKVYPRTGREGSEGELWYSCTLSLTSVRDGVGWSTPRPSHFTPGKDPVPIVKEAGWTGTEKRKYIAPTGFEPRTIQPAIPGPSTFGMLRLLYFKWLTSRAIFVQS